MTVTDEDMMQVVAKWTGIPLKRMEAGEIQRLLDMENELSRIVISRRRRHRSVQGPSSLSSRLPEDPRRPISTFALLGPTGVGKPYLPKPLPPTCSEMRNPSSSST